MLSSPKVSVILTSFNHEKYLREAIDSVLNQTYHNFELIIWDDASSDDSWSIINSYTDSRIKAFRNEEQCRGTHNINKAITDISSGEYIAIHHSDDVWQPKKLEKQVRFLDSRSDIGAVFTWVQIINEDGKESPEDWFNRNNQSRWKWLNELFNEENHLNHPSVLIRRQCYESVGLYSYGLAQTGDAEMWSRLLLSYPIHIIQEKLTKHRLFSNKSNMSGARPEVFIRANNEWNFLRKNFLGIKKISDAYKIFPGLRNKYPNIKSDLKFLIAMACLFECNNKSAWQLGIYWLLELMNNPTDYQRIQHNYKFSYIELINLTSKYDVYSFIDEIEHDNQIKILNQEVTDRDGKISNFYQTLTDRDAQINNLNQTLTLRDGQITHFYQTIVERDGQINNLNQTIIEQDGQINNLNLTIVEQDEQINNLNLTIVEQDEQINNLNLTIVEQDEQINNLNLTIIEQDGQINNFNLTIIEQDGQINNLNQTIIEQDGQINNLNLTIVEQDEQVFWLKQAVQDVKNELKSVLISKSWQFTKPLRFARRIAISRPYALTRRIISNKSRDLWYAIPISFEVKRKLKEQAFSNIPWLFSWSEAYRAWEKFNAPINFNTVVNQPTLQQVQNPREYVPLLKGKNLEKKPVKLICFYLPQFHPIPENNIWWGDGFTEWTNVQPATPQFAGHYQPHVPGELGYYNLLDKAVQRRQVELAKLYGIEGFCFYFYWFAGKRLLETPIQNYLADASLDLPFCLCWANENWSRRWNGEDKDILIAQQHSAEDDIAFIEHIAPYMRDSRYIRINGKPLLLVYRPSLLPSAKETAKRWRDWCQSNGIGEIYLAYTQSFETINPAQYGFDAAIEFPPNNSSPPNITDTVTPLTDDTGYTVYDWRIFVERSEQYKQPDYTLFRSVCPSWDNTARRKNRGTVFLNSTPKLYQQWLKNAVRHTTKQHANQDERLIFINAWNEWAEGAHLEPDTHYGYAWLQATRNALSGETYTPDYHRKIILVTHDAYPHGAQLLALNLARTLNQGMGFHVDLVCLGDGPLKAEYAKWATLHDLTNKNPHGEEAVILAQTLHASGNRSALVNTTVSGYFLETLSKQGIECLALIHELRGVLEQHQLHGQAEAIVKYADKIVFPAIEVATSFEEVAHISNAKLVIRPQGLYKRRNITSDRSITRMQLREKLALPNDSLIVLGAGYADHRKGIDLFVEAGLEIIKNFSNVYWVWIGHWEQSMQSLIQKELTQYPSLKDKFIFPGLQSDTDLYYGGADIFALTSREDPFPSVVLEAMDAGLPIVGFEEAGGFIQLLNEGCGKLAAKEDAKAFAEIIGDLINFPDKRNTLGQQGEVLINERFSFRHYVFDLLDLLGQGLKRISVVVPNFNYAHYLPERLLSIIKQDYPVFEIIFLDDCSTDQSIKIAQNILEPQEIDCKLIINEQNSGSVFKQWKKGVDHARGNYVWIAEADDSCESNFLNEVIRGFNDPNVVLSYCESKQMDENGNLLANNYRTYVDDIDSKHWLNYYSNDGHVEVKMALSIKNTIPNVSAVLFEKTRLINTLDKYMKLIISYRVAGDWIVYANLLKDGKIAFSPLPLNNHRRHSRGVTISGFNEDQLKEIQRAQAFIADEFDIPFTQTAAAKQYIKALSIQFCLGS